MQTPKITKLLTITSIVAVFSGFFLYQMALAATQGSWPSTAAPSDIPIATAARSAENNQHITQASDGDYIVTYGLLGSVYAQKFSATDGSALAAWNGGAATNVGTGTPSAIIPDTAGGAYIAWNTDFGAGNCDILLQRLNSSGATVFVREITISAGGGVCEVFMDMIPDGTGGFYLAWGNGGSFSSSGTTDLYITRIDSSGSVDSNWNTGGVYTLRGVQFPETTGTPSSEHSAQIVDDGAGNVVAIYESSDAAFYFAATKFSSTGAIAGAPWSTPLEIDTASNGNLGRHLIADGSGGVIVGFLSGPFGSPTDIELQRINSAGALQWGAGVSASSTNISGFSGQPRIVGDGSGGAIVGWHTAGGGSFDTFAHHVTSAGALDATGGWAAAPIAISDTTDGNTDWFVTLDRGTAQSDGAGGAYFLYASYEGGAWPVSKLQHIESDGTVEFAGDGTTLATGVGIEGIESIMISDGSTGVVTVFQDEELVGATDLYMQYFDDVASSRGGATTGARACTVHPIKLDLPQTLDVFQQNGQSVVELNWADAQSQDAAAAEKVKVLFDYLDQDPTPELDSTGKTLKSVFAKQSYNQIYNSGNAALVDTFEKQLKELAAKEDETTLQILKTFGIEYQNDYFSDWWVYFFVDRLKSNRALKTAFISAMTESLESEPISYETLIKNLLKEFNNIQKSSQELEAVQCIQKVVEDVSLTDFIPGQGENVYGSFDGLLKGLIAQMNKKANINSTLNGLKNNQAFLNSTSSSLELGINALIFGWSNNNQIQQIIDFYQTDKDFRQFKEIFFNTEIIKEMEGCLRGAYKRDLLTSINEIRFQLMQKAIEKSEVCDDNTSMIILQALKTMFEAGNPEIESVILRFINELLSVEKHLSESTAYKDSFSDYFNANYSPLSSGVSSDMTLEIYRDGRLIHSAENPSFTSYLDESVPVNTDSRVKNHNYYLLTKTDCDTKTGSEGMASIDPQLEPGTKIEVSADMKVTIKQGFNVLFAEKLQALVQSAKALNQRRLTQSIDQAFEANVAIDQEGMCQESSQKINDRVPNSSELMDYILACHGSSDLNPSIKNRRVKIIPPLLIALKLNSSAGNQEVIDRFIGPVLAELKSEISNTEKVLSLVGGQLSKLNPSKSISDFTEDEKALIKCIGVPNCTQDLKDEIMTYFEGSSHAADITVEVYDKSEKLIHEVEARTDFFGEVKNLELGQFLAGDEYTIKIRLKDERFVLPKLSKITLNTAEPKSGGGFHAHLDLAYSRQFRYGNFDESNDVIDRNDILTWGRLIAENPELWNDSNLDGLYGVDLLDVITFQQNWGDIQESRVEEDQITLMRLANIFGLTTNQETRLQVPSWLKFLELSCNG